MPLSPGDKLGPYEILSPLGAGGMGEVYKARDTRLDRIVAIKVSKTAFDQRFGREARAVAALNHPNICALYDVGPNYLVMEYVEGTELRGPLPVERAVELGCQILDALDAAHRKGITHRDLKPANVMVIKSGVKVLDFGLAKIGRAPGALRSDEKTALAPLTVEGTIAGTLFYMAPEQLQGKPDVDSRADIFSFGCVLYEMLMGKRAFDGSSPASVIAALMERPAPSIMGVAPAGLDQVLKKCLAKDPDERWQSARDLKAALELAAGSAEGVGHVAPPKPHRQLWLTASVGAMMAGLAAAGVLLWTHSGESRGQLRRRAVHLQIPLQRNIATAYAVSPDGERLAYFDASPQGVTAIRIRTMSSGATQDYPDTETALPSSLFWSPDSRALYFGNDHFLKRMEIARSGVRQVCQCRAASGAVNQTGDVLLSAMLSGRFPGEAGKPELSLISASGRERMLQDGRGGPGGPESPVFLPDGRRYLFARGGGLFLASLDDAPNTARRVGDAPGAFQLASISGGSVLLFVPNDRQRDVQVVPFNISNGEVGGAVRTIPIAALTRLSVSRDGILITQTRAPGNLTSIPEWFDRAGNGAGQAAPPDAYGGVGLSPDGVRLAYFLQRGGGGTLWVRDPARGTAMRVAPEMTGDICVWSPDGKSLAFSVQDSEGFRQIYRADANNLRPPAALTDGGREPGSHFLMDWSRDGKYLLYAFQGRGQTFRDLRALRIDDPAAQPMVLVKANAVLRQAQFSPSGKYLAYVSEESGRHEVYVQPFPDAGKGKWLISQGGGFEPRWSPDGRELFFFTGQKLMTVGVSGDGDNLTTSAPRELFTAPISGGYTNDAHRWEVSPDGRRFLLLAPTAGQTGVPLEVTVNWDTLLSPDESRKR